MIRVAVALLVLAGCAVEEPGHPGAARVAELGLAEEQPAANTERHMLLGPTTARPLVSTTAFDGNAWLLTRTETELYFPVTLPCDCAITQWAVHVTKGWGPAGMSARLQNVYYSGPFVVGSEINVTGQAGLLHLTGPPLLHVVMPDRSYAIRVARDNFYFSTDAVWFAEVWFTCPFAGP